MIKLSLTISLLILLSLTNLNSQSTEERLYFDCMFNAERQLEQNSLNPAIKSFKQALKYKKTKQAYMSLTKTYSKKNNIRKAYKAFENYVKLEEVDKLSNILTDPDFFYLSFNEKKWYKVISDIHYRSFSYTKSSEKVYKSIYNQVSYKEYIEDITVLYETIINTHPGVNWYISKSEFEQEYQYYLNKFNDSSDINSIDIYKSSIELVEKIKCGHSAVQLSSKQIEEITKKNFFFPYPIKVINNEIYVFKNNTSFNEKLISIDNISTSEILTTLHKDNFGDGYSTTIGDYDLEQFFDIYFTLYFGSNDSIKIELLNPTTNKITKKNYAMIDTKTSQKLFYKAHKSFSDELKIKYDKIENKATLKINTFTNNNLYNHLMFENTYLEFFKTVRDSNYSNVVIDLRDNLGGYYQNVRLLLSYFLNENNNPYESFNIANIDSLCTIDYLSIDDELIHDMKMHFDYKNGKYTFREEVISPLPLNKYSFNGNVFILVSGKSFSGSSLFTSIMKESYHNTTIIGEETGGGKNGTTAYYSTELILPNSKIEITIPLVKMVVNTEQSSKSGGIIPDYQITYEYNDYTLKIDKENTQVNNLIKLRTNESLITEMIENE